MPQHHAVFAVFPYSCYFCIMNRYSFAVLATVAALAAALLPSCASMGRPEGGPRDFTPPVVLRSVPADGSVNFDGKRLSIYFNENVQIDNPMEKVVVSPAQKYPPAVSAVGKMVRVEFRDTLLEDATYTVDFSDAIRDLNEGNSLDGFALDFSTGPVLDSLRISGMVFEARNLEPAQGMIVGAYSCLDDSCISSVPFERITKTNALGQFTLRGLKAQPYRIFAVKDMNRDYHWDRSEDIAFLDSAVTPSCRTVEITDTLADAAGADSLVTRTAIFFEPNDLLLTWFNEEYRSQYLAKNERPERRRLDFILGAPSDSLPQLTVVGGALDGVPDREWALATANRTRDTLSYWITDTLVSDLDSLQISVRYLRTDSADNLSWTVDTLNMYLRGNKTRAAELKKAAQEEEKRRKALEKGDTLPAPKPPVFAVRYNGSQVADLHKPWRFTTAEPVVGLDRSRITLTILRDTVELPLDVPVPEFADSLQLSSFKMGDAWEPGGKYTLTFLPGALRNVWGVENDTIVQKIAIHKLEDYSSIRFEIAGLPDTVPAFVELLDKGERVVAAAVLEGGAALFSYLMPGTYYARLTIDPNGNGLFDKGSVAQKIQPEEVYYYPQKLNLKKNWDITQNWDIAALPIDQQKPQEIKKNKPAKKRGEKDNPRYDGNEDDEDDEFTGGLSPRGNVNSTRDNSRGSTRMGETVIPRGNFGQSAQNRFSNR